MELLEIDDVPLTVHEDILNYLREQDLLDGEDEALVQNITNFTEVQIKEILEGLLQKFERNQKLKEKYLERVKAHNQYPLFALENILPDFEIDDEMFDALTFRETLIVNRLVGDIEIAPEPVGGLCLDIQQAPGRPPQERSHSNINSLLSRIFRTNDDADVINMDDIKVEDTKCTEVELKTSSDLEDSLERQTSRSMSKFLIHMSSQFDLNGYNAGSTITAWVDKSLHTLEEARKEFYTVRDVKATTQSEASVELTKEPSNKISKHSSEKIPKKKSGDRDSSQKALRKSIDKEHRSRSERLSKRMNEPTPKRLSKMTDNRAGKDSTTKTEQATELLANKTEDKGSKISGKPMHKKSSRTHSHTSDKQTTQKKYSVTENEKSYKKGSKTTNTQSRKEEIPDKKQAEGAGDETKVKTKLLQKSLYVGLLKKFYYIKHLSSEDALDNRKFYSLYKAKDYISEGANFILQRYLAKTIYIGNFELSTMYINGDMCRNIYNCTGPESQVVNDCRIDVCKIYRTIIEECGIEHKCTTVLTLQGQIVHQMWKGADYTLQMNPLLDLKNYKTVGNEQILLKHAWESDMQLMSKYLDSKIENDIKIKSYMIDHPEFRNMISDYIHTILLLKPEDILEFTISHFLSFAPQFLPQNDYFNTN